LDARTAALCGLEFGWPNQNRRRDLKRFRKGDQRNDAEVEARAFYALHLPNIQIGKFCELLLRQPAGFSHAANVRGNAAEDPDCPRLAHSHASTGDRLA
jgi:hypothetical protein